MANLEIARQTINEIDKKMALLFEERMNAVKQVAEYKKEHGLQVTDANREELIIAKNANYIKDNDFKSYYINFLRNNIEISKTYQLKLLEGMRVAFSGVKGAFADIAAKRIFETAIRTAYPDFKSAYESVVNGECECVVLPIENSYNGDVGQVMDLIFFGPLFINGIYDIEIVQNLLGLPGATVHTIKEVISHPQALGQCAKYISEHGFDCIEALNTAVAAKTVSQSGRIDLAAIGSEEAANEFGLKKIEGHINESSKNTTRFVVLSRTPKEECISDKHFVLLFTVNNEAGSLGKAVSIIGENGFNLKALKSRPTKELVWSYYFYAEGEGNINSEQGKKMLKELEQCCNNVKIVGSFEKEISL